MAATVTLSVVALVFWAVILVALTVQAVQLVSLLRRPRRPSLGFDAVAPLDARTTAILHALEPLSLEEAHAVLWSVLRLVDATRGVSQLWPDAKNLTAGAAVARAAT